MRLARRIGYWWRFRDEQSDLRDELAFHREQVASDLARRGLSADDARDTARRTMGNETYMREEARGVWLSAGIDAMVNDVRYAWRGLRRSPVFTIVVVLTLALGIGASSAIFSVVHHLLLAPLPYPDGNRIVRLETVSPSDPSISFGFGTEMMRESEARSRTLEDFAADKEGRYSLGDEANADSVGGAAITPSFMNMLRVQPVLGRGFGSDDARIDAAPVAMIGYALWQARFGDARDVLGRILRIDGIPRIVVGVAPKEMAIPMSDQKQPEIWLPLHLDSGSNFNAFARLRPGITSDAASRELQSISQELTARSITSSTQRFDKEWKKGWRARAVRAQDLIDANEKRGVETLFVAVAGLLLIACANIASLLLMRTWTRQRELAIRRALGAGRLRIARQLLTESLMLALLGGGLGFAIAWRGLHAIIALRPGSLDDLDGVHIDAEVLLWTAAISLATGLLFGVGPALFAGEDRAGESLHAGAQATGGSIAARRLRGGMIVIEIALSFVFLVAAGVLVRSFVALEHTSIGYDPSGLIALYVRFAHQPPRADRAALEQTLIRSLDAVPGVQQAAFGGVAAVTSGTNVSMGPYLVEGPEGPQTSDLKLCETPYVAPEFFRVARIPFVEGRTFDASTGDNASRELIVNRALARRLWPNGRALGARLRVGDGDDATWLTVVGVVGDVHLPSAMFNSSVGTNGDLFKFQMYRPANAAPEFQSNALLRVDRITTGLEPALKNAVDAAGVSATLKEFKPVEGLIDSHVYARPRFALVLFGMFASIALAVSAVGLYAIVAYTVAQRTREIGVRVALGADTRAVVQLVLSDSARLVLAGACVGLIGALAATKALGGFLYQMSPSDPFVFGGVVVLVIVVALAASIVPMRRALRIDPMDALRTD